MLLQWAMLGQEGLSLPSAAPSMQESQPLDRALLQPAKVQSQIKHLVSRSQV